MWAWFLSFYNYFLKLQGNCQCYEGMHVFGRETFRPD